MLEVLGRGYIFYPLIKKSKYRQRNPWKWPALKNKINFLFSAILIESLQAPSYSVSIRPLSDHEQPFDSSAVAVIGAGQIAAAAHLPAALESRQIEVAAIVDNSRLRAELLLRDFRLDAKIAASIAEVRTEVEASEDARSNSSRLRSRPF